MTKRTMCNENIASALRNMVDDIHNLGAGPMTVDTALLREAIIALSHEDGYVLVPVEPTPGCLMSMALRSDHALGCPGYYDQEMLRYPGAPTHQQKLDAALREARQQYEEVVGRGFYSPEKEQSYAARPEIPND